MSKRYVRVVKFADETGYSEKAVRRKIEEGIWVEGTHYVKSPDGRIHMEMGAYYQWLEQDNRKG